MKEVCNEFVGFPSIEGFHNVVKNGEYNTPKYNYRGKIKLHGTCAGIRLIGDQVVAESRTKIITPTDDNAGFAKWVEANKSYFQNKLTDHTVFGEWCGPGIMKGTAINQLSSKIFAIFAIQIGDGPEAPIVVDPVKIKEMLGTMSSDVHILPWFGESFKVDYGNRAELQETANRLNKLIEEIEPVDLWVKETFGIEGVCEGVVYYPSDSEPILKLLRASMISSICL